MPLWKTVLLPTLYSFLVICLRISSSPAPKYDLMKVQSSSLHMEYNTSLNILSSGLWKSSSAPLQKTKFSKLKNWEVIFAWSLDLWLRSLLAYSFLAHMYILIANAAFKMVVVIITLCACVKCVWAWPVRECACQAVSMESKASLVELLLSFHFYLGCGHRP